MSKYLSEWEGWERSVQLVHNGDYFWDTEAIQDTNMEWTKFLEEWFKVPEEDTRLSVAHVCSVFERKGKVRVLGKKDDGRFVLMVNLNESEEFSFGWLSKEEAMAFDSYVRANKAYQNAGPWVKWVVQKTCNVLMFFGMGDKDWDKTKPYANS